MNKMSKLLNRSRIFMTHWGEVRKVTHAWIALDPDFT